MKRLDRLTKLARTKRLVTVAKLLETDNSSVGSVVEWAASGQVKKWLRHVLVVTVDKDGSVTANGNVSRAGAVYLLQKAALMLLNGELLAMLPEHSGEGLTDPISADISEPVYGIDDDGEECE